MSPPEPVAQATVAVSSAVGALLDPQREDLIGALGETTVKPLFAIKIYIHIFYIQFRYTKDILSYN